MTTELPLSYAEPGAVVELEGRPMRVVGTLHLVEDGTHWREHHLAEGLVGRSWLTVENEDGLTVTWWTARPELAAEPEGRWMRLDGRRWTRRERGTASYTATGETATGPAGTCEYADYASDGDLLSFERFDGGPWEVSTGRPVDPHAVRVMRDDSAAQG